MAKVVICLPTLKRPYPQTVDSIRAEVPLLEAAGFEHGLAQEIGCPYISAARATMLRKALDAKADVIVFIDHDVSWEPGSLVKLVQTEGDVVAGTYRFKHADEAPPEYMAGLICDAAGRPHVRPDGCIKADKAPAGFLKITTACVEKFMTSYPELCYGPKYHQSVDLFNHGAHQGHWWGEDYAFCRRWIECGGEVWIVPDLNIAHHSEDKSYPGNFHQYMLRQPGGSESDNPVPPREALAAALAKRRA